MKDLDKRAGDFVSGGDERSRRAVGAGRRRHVRRSYKLVDLAKGNGKIHDPTCARTSCAHTLNELGRFNNLRAKAAKAIGQDVPGLPNIAKLSMSEIVRSAARHRPRHPRPVRHAARLQARGPRPAQRGHRQPVRRHGHRHGAVRAGPPIYGGTDQIQRNIIGERVLGLPKEANNDKTAAFKDLPKNA